MSGDPTHARRTGCTVPGCGGRHYARGWCHPHYGRWYRHGDPLGGSPPRPPRRTPTRDEVLAEAATALLDALEATEMVAAVAALPDEAGR